MTDEELTEIWKRGKKLCAIKHFDYDEKTYTLTFMTEGGQKEAVDLSGLKKEIDSFREEEFLKS